MYQIFISYRREGSEFLGKILYDRLTAAGYKVFYDVESLRSGTFNEQLYRHVDGCTDFILLLPAHALDRCIGNPDDWVLREVARAIQGGKNIIPVRMRGFEDFPENLPAEIASLPDYECLDASVQEYFDAAFDRLCEHFLKSKPQSTGQNAGRAGGRLAVTTSLRMTECVKQFLNSLRPAMLEKFIHLLGDGGSAPVRQLFSIWENAEKSYLSNLGDLITEAEKRDRQREIEEMRAAAAKAAGLPESEQQEIRMFCREVLSLRYLYRTDGMTYRDPGRQHFSYESAVWDVMDVFDTGDLRWAAATSAGSGLLPDFGIFQVADDGSLLRMQPRSQEYTMALFFYGVSIRLMDLFPPYVEEKLGPDLMRQLVQQLRSQMPGTDTDLILQNNRFHNISVCGDTVGKRLFTTVTSYVSISREACFTVNPETMRDNRMTPFGEQQALDIVQVRQTAFSPCDYLVLTCPIVSKGNVYFKDQPHVYRVEKTDRGMKQPLLSITEIRPGAQTAIEPGVLERFALRMAMYRINGVVG